MNSRQHRHHRTGQGDGLLSRSVRGFTLIEVMIALSVFAVIATGLIYTASQSIRNTETLQDRTLGRWVAENQVSELRLSGAPAIDTYTETVSNFGRNWQLEWQVEDPQSETYGARIRRVTINVYLDDGETNVDELIVLIPVTP